ncbi:MAG: hypothetical protein KOO69_01155, partial [Victivallales bacterium]|nr:hypothetical protein [Victivallales bacterium]
MKIGTKSVLFGVHQFMIHPVLVLYAWLIVHRSCPSMAELVAIITHDIGYWGMPNMDGPEGSGHPENAASFWRGRFGTFGDSVADLILGHSRFHAKANNLPLSKLFQPDKLATALYPIWLYLLLANLSGEIKEYMSLRGSEKYPDHQPRAQTQVQWFLEIQGNMVLMGIQGEANLALNDFLKEDKTLNMKVIKKSVNQGAQLATRLILSAMLLLFAGCVAKDESKVYTNKIEFYKEKPQKILYVMPKQKAIAPEYRKINFPETVIAENNLNIQMLDSLNEYEKSFIPVAQKEI